MKTFYNILTRRKLHVITVVLIFVSIFTVACSDSEETKKKIESSSTSTSTVEQLENDGGVENSTTLPDVIETKLDETISDTDAGYTIKINRILKGVPFNSDQVEKMNNAGGATGYFVEISVDNSSPFNFDVISNYFALLPEGNEYDNDNNADWFTEYAQKNNLDLFEYLDKIKTGTKQTIWLSFVVYSEDDGKDLSLVYTRNGIKKSDGSSIPEKTIKVKILEN